MFEKNGLPFECCPCHLKLAFSTGDIHKKLSIGFNLENFSFALAAFLISSLNSISLAFMFWNYIVKCIYINYCCNSSSVDCIFNLWMMFLFIPFFIMPFVIILNCLILISLSHFSFVLCFPMLFVWYSSIPFFQPHSHLVSRI